MLRPAAPQTPIPPKNNTSSRRKPLGSISNRARESRESLKAPTSAIAANPSRNSSLRVDTSSRPTEPSVPEPSTRSRAKQDSRDGIFRFRPEGSDSDGWAFVDSPLPTVLDTRRVGDRGPRSLPLPLSFSSGSSNSQDESRDDGDPDSSGTSVDASVTTPSSSFREEDSDSYPNGEDQECEASEDRTYVEHSEKNELESSLDSSDSPVYSNHRLSEVSDRNYDGSGEDESNDEEEESSDAESDGHVCGGVREGSKVRSREHNNRILALAAVDAQKPTRESDQTIQTVIEKFKEIQLTETAALVEDISFDESVILGDLQDDSSLESIFRRIR